MRQLALRTIVASLIALLFFQACAGLQTSKAPDRSVHLPPGELQSKIVSILETPPFEYKILSRAQGKIRAQKEYPGDPYGLPFLTLEKRMQERALLTVNLIPSETRPGQTEVYVRVELEEKELAYDVWQVKNDREKKQEIISELLRRIDKEINDS